MKNIHLYIHVVFLLLIGGNTFAQNWYELSEQRIDEIRKGDFTFLVVDEIGDTITQEVSVKLDKHEFPWGTVIPVQGQQDYEWVRAVAVKYFNYGVTGNHFKWPWIENPKDSIDYTLQEEVVDWIEKVGFGFRGHALIWGGAASYQMPAWTLDTVALTPEMLYDECETHIRREVDHFKGRVDQYDVINEPSFGHATWLANRVGDSINWNSFKWTKEADSSARLFVNDYNIIVHGSAVSYRSLIQEMLDNGAPVEGIGVQAHMENVIDWEDIKDKLDYMAELGLPIFVTEFDMKVESLGMTQLQQAEDYAKMMRIAFSHPAVEGFMLWGLYDKEIYHPGSGIYSENRVPKIAADSVHRLLKEVWITDINQSADVNKEYKLRGFYGNYKVTVDFDGEERVFTVPFTAANEDSVFVLDYADAELPSPELLSTTLSGTGNEIEMKFNMKMDPSTFYNDQFEVFSEDQISFDSLSILDDDSTTISFCFTNPLKYRQFAAFYYYGDSVKALNGNALGYVGPETIENGLPGFVMAETNTEGNIINITFSKEMSSSVQASEFSVLVNGDEATVSSAELSSGDAHIIIIELSEPVEYADFITVTYTESGAYTSADNYVLYTFGPKYVQNNVENPVVGIRQSDINSIVVYPNPFTNELKFKGLNNVAAIQILDINGKQIYSVNTVENESITIQTAEFPSGILFYRIIDKSGNILITEKVLKK